MKVTIVIPTVDRTDTLVCAVGACAEQCVDGEIVVVDNSRDGRQSRILAALEDGTRAPTILRHVHEPRPGLACARNRGIAEAQGEFVAFLDDDQLPHPGWLAGLIGALVETGGDAAFGPVVPTFGERPRRLRDFAASLFTRRLAAGHHEEVSRLFNLLGTGNSCFRTATCFVENSQPFNPQFNETGGEDTDFLRRLSLAGRKLVWAPDAVVDEFVPAARTTVAAMAARRFSQGQMRTYSHLASPPRRIDKMAFWMAAGAVQYAGHTVLGAAEMLLGWEDDADIHRIQAMGGLGKLLWQEKFRQRRYGEAQ
jgi:succinoglycan biosynthesis protein ExoM